MGAFMNKKSKLFATAAYSAIIWWGGANAQEIDAESADSGSLKDVLVVTAQRREQNLQEVPQSLTVFSAEQLELSRIETTDDILLRTPNVSFETQGSVLTLDLGIRGVTNIGGAINSNAVYVDEFNITPLDISATLSPELLDVERVEVLRGPQGTLFGRNVSGGAINITTKKPGDAFEASVTGEYANFGSYLVRGSVNVPLGDKLATRVSGYYRERDGFIDDLDPAGGFTKNDFENWGGRAAVRFEPTDRWTMDASVSYRDYQQGFDDAISTGEVSPDYVALASLGSDATVFDLFDVDAQVRALESLSLIPPGTAAAFEGGAPIAPVDAIFALDDGQGFFPENDDTISIDSPHFRENELIIVNAASEYDFGAFSLIGNFGYINSDTNSSFDEDATSLPVSTLVSRSELESWSAEVRLRSNGDNRLDWSFGLLYAQDSVDGGRENEALLFGLVQSFLPFINRSPLALSFPELFPGGVIIPETDNIAEIGDAVGLPPDDPGLALLGLNISLINEATIDELDSFGVFGDVSYEVNDRLELSFGLRYSRDELFSSLNAPGGFNPFVEDGFLPPVQIEGETTTNSISPRFTAVFNATDDINLYAQLSRGVKPGGVNLSAIQAAEAFSLELPVAFEQESLWNYEAGVKGGLLNDNIVFSFAAFYIDWTDVQIDSFVLTPTLTPVFLTQNVPSAESYGVELEFTANTPIEGLTLLGGFGFNETEIGKFDTAVDQLGASQSVTGNALPLAPRWTGNIGADYRTPVLFQQDTVGDVQGLLQMEYLYRGSQFTFITDQAVGFPGNEIGDYDSLNLRGGFTSDRLDLVAFVENLTNDTYISGFRVGSFANGVQAAINPRTFGVRLTLRN